MGKHKQRRFKSHFPAPQTEDSKKDFPLESTSTGTSFTSLPINFKENVFEGVMIPDLMKGLPKNDDNISMKSYISNKSMKGEKAITKKEKLKMRREMFLRKMDTVNQSKKDNRLRKKKILSDIGDAKPSFDDLPSLDSLFKLTDKSEPKKPKKKAIEKSKKIQKSIIQNISIYKKLLKNPSLEKNPFEAISSHLKAVVEEERKKLKSK
ncbi:hypothetical protein WA026_021052 [Henosepilachna vigintioctopunctata]|uniref:Ribosome biogenesis protein SLX9 n=1 Tax=Henosepilachna vigintioctopunctata TaxID=420089 RepID=A0AAW1UVT6_9CUCU